MKLYCPSCGQATEYTINPPNFCGSCGKAYNAAFATTPSPKPQPKAPCACGNHNDHQDEDGNDLPYTPLPNIKEPAVIIEVDRPRGVKYSEIAGTGGGNLKRDPLKVDRRRKKKDIAQDIMSVCQSSRGRNAEID